MVRYLNHAGTSWPKPDLVHRAVRDALRASPPFTDLLAAATHTLLEEFQAAPKGGRLRLTSGCTAALALALGDLPWAAGDVLITSSLEHHALERQALALTRNRGVERVSLNYSLAEPVDLSQLEATLRTGKVRAVALSAASNVTGQLLPLPDIGTLTREFGVLLLVDAAQTFGTDSFEECAAAADIIVAAGHKAALGPHGIGLLYARANVQFASPAAVCEITERRCDTFPGFCDAGSINVAGACGLAAGLSWSRPRRSEIATNTRALADELRNALANRSDVLLLGPTPGHSNYYPQRMTSAVSFLPKRLPLDAVAAHFAAHQVLLRVGTHCASAALEALGAPLGSARASFGPENEAADVSAVLQALDAI